MSGGDHWLRRIHPQSVPARYLSLPYSLGLGWIAAALFVICCVTGLLLAFHFRATADEAYESILDIVSVVSYGRLVRNVHRFSADGMVIGCVLHMARVFFRRDYGGTCHALAASLEKRDHETQDMKNWIGAGGLALVTALFVTSQAAYRLGYGAYGFNARYQRARGSTDRNGMLGDALFGPSAYRPAEPCQYSPGLIAMLAGSGTSGGDEDIGSRGPMMSKPKDRATTSSQSEASRMTLAGGGLRCTFDGRNARIAELIHEATGDVFVSDRTAVGGLEVYDELDRRWYSDLQSESTLTELHCSREQIQFVKQFAGAPFALDCCWRADATGVHLQVDARLLREQPMRSVRISLVLPTTAGLISWAPSYPKPSDVREKPARYCYLADERGKARTGIPMLTLYHQDRGGLSIVMPFEVPKVQLNMGVEPTDPTPWYVPERVPRINAGAEVDTVTPPEAGELGAHPVIRFTEKHVGLRPDKPLRFALWLYGHEPDWRPGFGRVVERYRDYFEPHPASLKLAGGRFRADPGTVTEAKIQAAEGSGATHAWFHGHFESHGEFLTDEVLRDPGYRWVCEPYPDRFRNLSVEQIGGQIGMLKAAGIHTFLYGFNMHCDETIIEKRHLQADMARNEDGSIARAYHQQPVMFFHPESPFGRQLLEQMDRMMRTYPAIIGIGLDNWNYTGIDFGHDDGVTMVNNRPAANVNFSQQRMIGAIAAKLHGSGRLVMTNKGRTIESLRGVDFMGTEARGAETYATFAYMNVFRTVTPTEYASADDPKYAEYVLKYLLVWSGQMSSLEREADAAQARAYQPLLALLRNSRWVLEPNPLRLPTGTEGEIFRIDPCSPVNADAVVVTIVRPEVSWRENKFQDGMSVIIRLSDAERFQGAEYLAVERSAAPPVPCRIKRDAGRELCVELPPVGAAAVLKLTRTGRAD